jgi:hypothetical protein
VEGDVLNSSDIASLYKLTQSQKYDPEDLDKMHQAFVRLCGENPPLAETAEQRTLLAKCVIETYQHHLTQTQLLEAALHASRKASVKEMKDAENLWQDTVDIAVSTLEKRTGLKLAGLSQPEITQRVREWLKAKQAGTS